VACALIGYSRWCQAWLCPNAGPSATCATDLTPHLDLVTISKGVLNHRDLNTTQIYVQPISNALLMR
jgi:hypothetical protein